MEPTEEMLSILGFQNGAQVEQYLRQVMVRYSIHLEPGLYLVLNKGITVHSYFSPHLSLTEQENSKYWPAEIGSSVKVLRGGRRTTDEDGHLRTDEVSEFETAIVEYSWADIEDVWGVNPFSSTA